ncbi:MAG TPA: hypothetical protein VGC95_10575 [Chitinophagaceae bacterium]
MNLRETLLNRYERSTPQRVARWVGGIQSRFDELFVIFIDAGYRLNQRAAAALAICIAKHPKVIKKHLPALVSLHRQSPNVSLKRNSLRLLQAVEIPENLQGDLMDVCFDYIAAKGEPVAVKAFALTILVRMSAYHPDIRRELRLLVERQLPHETAAFRARARKFLTNS